MGKEVPDWRVKVSGDAEEGDKLRSEEDCKMKKKENETRKSTESDSTLTCGKLAS